MGVKVRGPIGYGVPEHPLARGGTIAAGTVFEVDELEAERLVATRGFEVVEELGDLGDGDDEPGDGEGDSRPDSEADAPAPAGRLADLAPATPKVVKPKAKAKPKGKGR